MSTMTQHPITLPPIHCPTWCQDGTGHTEATHPDDQWCSSKAAEVELTRHALVDWSGDGTDFRRDRVVVTLRKEHEGIAHVVLDHEGVAAQQFNKLPMFELQLNKAEAMALGEALRDLAAQL